MESLATLRPSDVYRVIGSLEMWFLAIVRHGIDFLDGPDQSSRYPGHPKGEWGGYFVINGNFCSLSPFHFLGIINTRLFVNNICLSIRYIYIFRKREKLWFYLRKGNDRYRQPYQRRYNKRANTHPINWLGIRKLVL